MKLFIAILICLALASCGWAGRLVAHYTGYDTFCIDGVKYIQFTSGATVKYTADGKIETCTQ